MLMDSLAHAAIDCLTLEKLRLESCKVKKLHTFTMYPDSVERFVYITRGEATFYLDQGTLSATARDMIYLPRNTAYLSRWHSDSDFVVVDLILRDGNGQDIRFGERPCVLFHDTHRVYNSLLSELGAKADADGPFDWIERLSLCFKLLCNMARDTNRRELDENFRRIKEGVDYLEGNLDINVSVGELASMCCVSESVFRRLFFACKGMSPVDYRNRLRVKKASELLQSGKYTITEAAEQVGINDLKYFGKLFKRYAGVTPRTIKNNKL